MKDFQEIVKRIAREDNTTPEIVLKEMQKAIDAAYEHHDPAAQPFWDALHFTGSQPTPEEFVLQLAQMLQCGSDFMH